MQSKRTCLKKTCKVIAFFGVKKNTQSDAFFENNRQSEFYPNK
jgi:hypothetical protein